MGRPVRLALITEARRRARLHRAFDYIDTTPASNIAKDFNLNGLGMAVRPIADAYEAAWWGRPFTYGQFTWRADQ